MEDKRKEILELDSKKLKLEEKIKSLTDYLNQEGMPGVNGSLIDGEGFPFPNLDLIKIREARHDLICSQNDLNKIMSQIELKISSYFEEIQSKNLKKANENKNDSIKDFNNPKNIISLPGIEDESYRGIGSGGLLEPFAKISYVNCNSPAEKAGLMNNDFILNFGGFIFKGSSVNPLQAISTLVRDNINKELKVTIARKIENEKLNIIEIKLIPQYWEGNGVLGCKLELL